MNEDGLDKKTPFGREKSAEHENEYVQSSLGKTSGNSGNNVSN
jgi:hypothetical protein